MRAQLNHSEKVQQQKSLFLQNYWSKKTIQPCKQGWITFSLFLFLRKNSSDFEQCRVIKPRAPICHFFHQNVNSLLSRQVINGTIRGNNLVSLCWFFLQGGLFLVGNKIPPIFRAAQRNSR